MKRSVFISYRRDDEPATAGRFRDRLTSKGMRYNVFMDVAAIDGGVYFAKEIEAAINGCDVFLAFIGSDWKGTDNVNRLEQKDDYVRFELRTAMLREKRIVPVLVDGAKMPSANLPSDIRNISKINAVVLRNSHFDTDCENLIRIVDGKEKVHASRSNRVLGGLAGAVVGAIVYLVVGLVNHAVTGSALSSSIGYWETVSLFLALVFLGLALGIRGLKLRRSKQRWL